MLGAMSLRPSLAAMAACLLLAACGGSSPSSGSTSTTASSAAASTAPTSATQTAAPAGTATNGAAAVTTTSTTTRPPEVPKSKGTGGKAKQPGTSNPSGGVGESSGARVSTRLEIHAGGQLEPPAVSIPAGVTIALKLTDADHAAHTVVLAVPQRQTVRLSAGARATASIPALRAGTYRILVDGTPRGQLLIGAQGGP
jgi:hypothetical protein